MNLAPDFPPFSIRHFESAPLNLRLHAPFGISGGSLPQVQNVLVKIMLDDGTLGWGEAAPLPAYNGETQEATLRVLEAARERIEGKSFDQWQDVARCFWPAAGARDEISNPTATRVASPPGAEKPSNPAASNGAAVCAVEMAVLDALCRRAGLSLWKFFGGAGTTLETDMTVTTGTPAEASAAARDIRARQIRLIKVKVGGPGGPATDLARIDAIREAAPDAPLILDGNAGLTSADARQLIAGLRHRRITPEVAEQWLPKHDLAGLRALAEETGWTIAADESVVTERDVHAIAAARAAQLVNIKLMKAGIAEALRVVGAARAAGLRLMIGGNVESILAMTSSACFAAGLGGFSYSDLDTPLFLAENPFTGGYRLNGATISVAHITAGHGVAYSASSAPRTA